MLVIPKWQYVLIGIFLLAGLVFALPNFLPKEVRQNLPGFLPKKTISLGLDLQGGSYLLYEVDLKTIQKEELQKKIRAVRIAFNEQEIATKRLGYEGKQITVTLTNPKDQQTAEKLLKKLFKPGQPGIYQKHYELKSDQDTSFVLTMTPALLRSLEDRALSQSIETIRRRLEQYGANEPTIQKHGKNRILVQMPGVKDPNRLKNLIGKTARMTFHLVASENPGDLEKALETRPKAGSLLLQTDNPAEPFLLIKERALLSGDNLVSSSQAFDQTGQAVVNFRFDTVGARKFGKVTAQNVGKRFAIVLDQNIITAPVIKQAILGGEGVISGNFTVESARDLSVLLNAGALPADLIVIEERTVGAELGADSIQSGKMASIIGFLAVFFFIFVIYGVKFGSFANLSLLANLFLITGLLSLLPVTLTLPGIAGVILTIGMAVDANVLIYERIREEIRAGRSPILAIDTGYKKALSPILDANITTMIAAFILMAVGSGPVKGFAYTLAVGIFTSVFTAFWVSRLIIASWVRARKPKQLPI